jgi:hypothetical protein
MACRVLIGCKYQQLLLIYDSFDYESPLPKMGIEHSELIPVPVVISQPTSAFQTYVNHVFGRKATHTIDVKESLLMTLAGILDPFRPPIPVMEHNFMFDFLEWLDPYTILHVEKNLTFKRVESVFRYAVITDRTKKPAEKLHVNVCGWTDGVEISILLTKDRLASLIGELKTYDFTKLDNFKHVKVPGKILRVSNEKEYESIVLKHYSTHSFFDEEVQAILRAILTGCYSKVMYNRGLVCRNYNTIAFTCRRYEEDEFILLCLKFSTGYFQDLRSKLHRLHKRGYQAKPDA